MNEIVIISGKGGTGKTSIVASFAALAKNAVLADCDVDAADLHLVLSPTIRQREEFRYGHEATIRQEDCIRCGACLARCRFEAVRKTDGGAGEARFTIDPTACEGCGVCVALCPVKAIDYPERLAGEWYVSETRCGPMVHARLNPGGENSGKLVSKVREAARQIAAERQRDLILIDGPPGVGCPVIASLAGASMVLIVTEPTLSGAHDMRRVIELTEHFHIPAAVCVNKWDLNPDMAERIEREARGKRLCLAGRVQYDRAVTDAQIKGKAVVEISGAHAGEDIRAVWEKVCE
ncbi:MAG: ATP-binding protein [Kiritimatiellae bacterium]|nr:ATP-binding protein [Kiritimatiellia bacterium]